MFLPYGRSSLYLPDQWDGRAIWVEPGPFPDVDGNKVVEKALDEPLRCPSISEMDLSGERIVCVVPDLTRRASVNVYLPILLSRLLSAGARPGNVTVIVALGIHRPMKDNELEKLVGREVWGRFRVANHDPDDDGGLVKMGVTSGNVPVEINSRVASADRIILTGGITYHYFAGYGGGRKAFLPGVASRRSCEAHHRMVVSWRRGELEGMVCPGILEGNPVHEQMVEACSFLPAVFALSVITDPLGRIVGASFGDLLEAHLDACRMHDLYYRREIREPSRLVIASAGGYPKDMNFIQAHKGLLSAHVPVDEEGCVVLAAECGEGAGYSDFFRWFERCQSEGTWFSELDRHYHINAQTAFSTWLNVRRTQTVLVSSLDPEEVRKTGMIPADNLEEALGKARDILGELPEPIVIPDAADTLTVVKSPETGV